MRIARRRWIWAVAVAGTILVVAGAGVYHYDVWQLRCPKLFDVVSPGRVYRGGQPAPRHMERLRREYGIRTFVSLREADRMRTDPNCREEVAFCEANGLKL